MTDIPDQATIAVFEDGVPLTMGDFKKIFAVLPPDNQPLVLRDRRTFLQQWAFMRKLAQMAEKQKLDQESPVRDQLEYSRLMILSQAKLSQALNSTVVDPGEIVKFYDTNKERFKEVLDPLADLLKAAVGATRAACDAGYAASDMQVGQIAFLLRRGPGLVRKYLDLLAQCRTDRNMEYHLRELRRLGACAGGKKAHGGRRSDD
jgi:hypothetical protein